MTTTQVPYTVHRADEIRTGDIIQAVMGGDVKWGTVIEAVRVSPDPDGMIEDPMAPFAPAMRVVTEHADLPTDTRWFRLSDDVRVVR